jgi:hypothetical protein
MPRAPQAVGAPALGAEDLPKPSREDIARRAYELYLRRGAADGQDVDDWLQAERELEETTRASLAAV